MGNEGVVSADAPLWGKQVGRVTRLNKEDEVMKFQTSSVIGFRDHVQDCVFL